MSRKTVLVLISVFIFYSLARIPYVFSKQAPAGAVIGKNTKKSFGIAASLNTAVLHGDIGTVRQILSSGANPSLRDVHEHGYSPLHVAVLNSNDPRQKEIIETLIAAGANLNVQDGFGNTPLNLILSRKGNKDIVKLLIEKGANVNSVGFEGITPLGSAIGSQDKEIVKALVDKKADVNRPDSSGRTPLMAAAESALTTGDTGIMEILISGGADVNARDNRGRTILNWVKGFRSSETNFFPDKVISVLKAGGAK